MKQAEEIVEPNYTCPHQNNQSFLYLEKLYIRLIILHQQPHTRMTRPQLLKQPMNQDKYLILRTTF